MKNTQVIKPKRSVGRPSVFTEEVVRKIEEVAALDGSVEEMAYYAGIHPDSIYTHFKINKEFSDRIKALRERPVLKARQTIVKALDDPQNAQWYIARKRKKEFAERVENQTELIIPQPIYGGLSVPEDTLPGHDSDKKDIQPEEENQGS